MMRRKSLLALIVKGSYSLVFQRLAHRPMPNAAAPRFRFIGHALAGDGPFRPVVTTDANGLARQSGTSYLIRYPRESDQKFARRNELAFYASPLAQKTMKFAGYMSTKQPMRELPHPLYKSMAEDIDGKGNDLDVFFSQFLVNAKARGSMLLLVDMDTAPLVTNQADQIVKRVAPYWSMVMPESVTDFAIGDDGKFTFAEFSGNWTNPETDERIPCTWRFDKESWSAKAQDAAGAQVVLAQGFHPLGECPLLIWTEGGDFPHFGPFASIADLSKRLFNLDSELDEILRSQTFSLLTMQTPDNTTEDMKVAMAQTAGQTIGTQNLIVHSGSTPAFIAPPDGPANVYLQRIDKLRAQIDEVGLDIATINQQESGVAMKMRFQAINSALSSCAERTEGLERRAWMLSQKWLQLSVEVSVSWPRDFDIADVENELKILQDMQSTGMPREVIVGQQKRIVALQFGNSETEDLDLMISAIEDQVRGVDTAENQDNVIQMPDRNAEARAALMQMVGSNGA